MCGNPYLSLIHYRRIGDTVSVLIVDPVFSTEGWDQFHNTETLTLPLYTAVDRVPRQKKVQSCRSNTPGNPEEDPPTYVTDEGEGSAKPFFPSYSSRHSGPPRTMHDPYSSRTRNPGSCLRGKVQGRRSSLRGFRSSCLILDLDGSVSPSPGPEVKCPHDGPSARTLDYPWHLRSSHAQGRGRVLGSEGPFRRDSVRSVLVPLRGFGDVQRGFENGVGTPLVRARQTVCPSDLCTTCTGRTRGPDRRTLRRTSTRGSSRGCPPNPAGGALPLGTSRLSRSQGTTQGPGTHLTVAQRSYDLGTLGSSRLPSPNCLTPSPFPSGRGFRMPSPNCLTLSPFPLGRGFRMCRTTTQGSCPTSGLVSPSLKLQLPTSLLGGSP